MANGNDWFSSGLGSVAAQQPIWPVPQGWQRPQQQLPDQPPERTGFWYGNPPDWLNRLGSSLSNLAGGNPQDYLGAISLAKVGKMDPWGGQAFQMMNEQGQKVGEIEAHMAEDDLLKIDWEGGGKNTLGFANSRSVLPELMREFPDMKRFQAYRVSGARHGPAAQYKGPPGSAGHLEYMTPIIKVPAHIKANPPNQWSGKWLHEDSGRWLDDAEGEPQRRRIFPLGASLQSETDRANRLLESLRGDQLMHESEHEEVPPALSQRVLDAARARESARQPVNTPEELRNLDRNIQAFRERQQMFNRPPPAPPAPPAPQPEVTSPGFARTDWSTALPQFDPSLGQPAGFNPTRYGIPTGQQTPGPFAAQPMGTIQQRWEDSPANYMNSLNLNRQIGLQELSNYYNAARPGGYGGAGSQRMEEE